MTGLLFVVMGLGAVGGMGVGVATTLFIMCYSILGLPVGAGFGVNHLDIAPVSMQQIAVACDIC